MPGTELISIPPIHRTSPNPPGLLSLSTPQTRPVRLSYSARLTCCLYNLPSLPPAPAPLRAQTSCPTPRDAFVCARVVPPSRLPTPRHTTTTPFLPTHHDLHAVARPPLRCCRSPYTPPLPHLRYSAARRTQYISSTHSALSLSRLLRVLTIQSTSTEPLHCTSPCPRHFPASHALPAPAVTP
jgi:hypothetical protein